MKRNIVNLLLSIALLLSASGINAQDSVKPIFYFGPYVDLNYNYHFTNFGSLPPFPNCCPDFRSGRGLGFSAGGFLEVEIYKDINFAVRLGISDIGANLSTREYIGGTFVNTTTKPVTLIDTSANVEYSVNSKLMTFDIEPMLGMEVFENFNAYLGFKVGYLFTSRFDQKEVIISPDNVTFLNGSRVRNSYKNELIPDVNAIQVFGTIGASYNLKIGRDLYLSPEIRYSVPFLDISKSKTKTSDYWKASTFQFGASLKIPVYPAAPPPVVDTTYKQEIIRDTNVIVSKDAIERIELKNTTSKVDNFYESETSLIIKTTIKEEYDKYVRKVIAPPSVNVSAYAYDKDGRKTKNPMITIEELQTEEGFPLLTQIFFKEGSSDLTSSGLNLIGSSDVNGFDENKLDWETMNIYKHLLNIIGSRLKQNPSASITITGCNNNLTPNEVNNQKLSIDRANTIRDYLIRTWSIEPPRLRIKRQNLPANPGNNTVAEGVEENQRAEISSDNFEITKPVFLKKIDRSANPPQIIIKPEVKTESGLKNWDISVSQKNTPLRKYSGEDLPDSVVWQVEPEPLPSTEDDVSIQLTAYDNESQKGTASDNLKISQRTISKKRVEQTGDKIIQKYSLILFDYDKSDLTPSHIKVLDKIKQEIKPGSKVEITGYADRTGLPDYNRELARKRAEETKKQLLVQGADYTIIPIGSDELIYDNNSPQGRSYCRTVKIRIETPVK